MTQIKLLHLGLTRYSVKLGKSDSYSILFDETKVSNAKSNSPLLPHPWTRTELQHWAYIIFGKLIIYSRLTLQIYPAVISPSLTPSLTHFD